MAHAFWHKELSLPGSFSTNQAVPEQEEMDIPGNFDLNSPNFGEGIDWSRFDFGRRKGDKNIKDRKSGKVGWNTGTLGAVGDIFSGFGDLASAYVGLENVKLGRAGLKQKAQGWNANYDAAMTTTNNPIRMQQAVLRSPFYDDPERAKSLQLVKPASLAV